MPLSRYSDQPQPIRALTAPEKINLLVVITKNSGLDTSGEQLALREVAAKLGGKISVDFLAGEATNQAIRAALRQKDYHFFHYAGHGSFANEKACIHLDNVAGGSTPMDAKSFAQFFLDYPSIRLVFLNACQGATRSAQQALVGVAPQLVLRGVPAVIAMQYAISNEDAILFATEFYEELCRERDGGQVEVAISRARKALLQDRPESQAFGNPVLYLRAEDGRLWETYKTELPKPPVEEKKPILEHWQTWVGLIGGILTIIAVFLEFPEKISKFSASIDEEAVITHFAGVVQDSVTKEFIVDAMVIVVGQRSDTVFSTNNGDFSFQKIPGQIGEGVRVYISKEGYNSYNEYVTLPSPKTFYLVKK